MAVIIDRTLTKIDGDTLMVPSDLIHFCELLITCGVTKIEATPQILYKLQDYLSVESQLLLNQTKTCFLTFEHGTWKIESNEFIEKNLDFTQIEDLQSKKVRLIGLEDLLTRDYETIFHNLLNSGAYSLDLYPNNHKHCATAIALEWLMMGGESISCSFGSCNDDANLEEILMALKINGKSNLVGDLSILRELKYVYEKITGEMIPEKKAVIGAGIFKVESGIHVDGVLKNPLIYEPFSPESVGNKRQIVLGKHSGQQSVLYKMRELNLSETNVNTILFQLKERCSNVGKSFSDLDLLTLVNEVHNGY